MSSLYPTILTGIDPASLQARLTAAQNAYIALTTGGQVQVAAYTQGDGAKSVTYNRSSLASLTALILQLQAALGVRCSPRRPIRVYFP